MSEASLTIRQILEILQSKGYPFEIGDDGSVFVTNEGHTIKLRCTKEKPDYLEMSILLAFEKKKVTELELYRIANEVARMTQFVKCQCRQTADGKLVALAVVQAYTSAERLAKSVDDYFDSLTGAATLLSERILIL